MAKVIGIDLGTTYSCVAVADGAGARVLLNKTGQPTTPSVVAVAESGKRLVGQLAKRQAITNPNNTVYGAKRLIGRRWSSPDVQKTLGWVSYKSVQGPHDDVRVLLGGREYAIPEISSMVLHEMRMVAEKALGEAVTQAVITVPAYFNDSQRQATKDAGTIAGLEVLRIINEPTAAALAYGYGKALAQKVAIFDLGGGTFDISILDIGEDVFEVLATAGDTFLGGEDFDERIIQLLVDDFQREHGVDLRADKMALQRLRDAAEKAKIDLSQATETEISLPFIYSASKSSALHIQTKLTRARFNDMVGDLVTRSLDICEQAVVKAGISKKDIKAVILVGGMTRMPLVRQQVERFFGIAPSKGVHPDEAVACGAALQAMLLSSPKSSTLLLDVTPHDLGLMVAGGGFDVLIEKNTTIPTSAQKVFTTVRDGQTQVRILVLQGLASRDRDNELLGEFVFDGLRPAPRGVVKIEVNFAIGADGIMAVSARDLESGRAQAITITAASGLTAQEVQKMMTENEEARLAAVVNDVFEGTRVDVERSIRELDKLLADARGVLDGTEVGHTAVRKSTEAMASARAAIDRRDGAAMSACREALERNAAFLRTMLNKQMGK
jgi:molecular chaperone DnaK